jgi:hypothetical protein
MFLDKEQCVLNLRQTTNINQCNIVIMNHSLSLILEIYRRKFSSSTLESPLKIHPIYIHHLIFHMIVNPSSRRNFKIMVSVQASQIPLSHEVFENKLSKLSCFFLSESLSTDFIIQLLCEGKQFRGIVTLNFPGSSTKLYRTESNRFPATHEIFHLICNLTAHYPVDSSPRVYWARFVQCTLSHFIFSVSICVQITFLWLLIFLSNVLPLSSVFENGSGGFL